MTPNELQDEARRLFGDGSALSHIHALAESLGMSPSAVKKWFYGERKIPNHVSVTLGLMPPSPPAPRR